MKNVIVNQKLLCQAISDVTCFGDTPYVSYRAIVSVCLYVCVDNYLIGVYVLVLISLVGIMQECWLL